MTITVISVGKLKEKYLKLAIDEDAKRLGRYCKLDIIELPDEKTPDNASEKEELIIKDKEGQLILSNLQYLPNLFAYSSIASFKYFSFNFPTEITVMFIYFFSYVKIFLLFTYIITNFYYWTYFF